MTPEIDPALVQAAAETVAQPQQQQVANAVGSGAADVVSGVIDAAGAAVDVADAGSGILDVVSGIFSIFD